MRPLEGHRNEFSLGVVGGSGNLLPGNCSACLGLDPGVSGASVPASPSFLDRPFGCAILTEVSYPFQQAKCSDVLRCLFTHAEIATIPST